MNNDTPPLNTDWLLAHWITAVTLVTTGTSEEWFAIATTQTTVIGNDKKQILVSLGQNTALHHALLTSRRFALSVLSIAQWEIAGQLPQVFSGKIGYSPDRLPLRWATSNAPVALNALSWVECTLKHSMDAADQTLFVGQISSGGTQDFGTPLLHPQVANWGNWSAFASRWHHHWMDWAAFWSQPPLTR